MNSAYEVNLKIKIPDPRLRKRPTAKLKKFKRRSLSRFLKNKSEGRGKRGEAARARWLQFYEVISLKDVETGTG